MEKKGYITYDELNEILPSEEVSSEQIEDIMAMFSDMGINVIENEEADDQLDLSQRTATSKNRTIWIIGCR